jgi:hypothetical protein
LGGAWRAAQPSLVCISPPVRATSATWQMGGYPMRHAQ